MAAGMLVGVIAIFYPEIVGNGKNIITSLIHYEFDATRAGILLFLKSSPSPSSSAWVRWGAP